MHFSGTTKKGIGLFCACFRPVVWGTLAINCERFLPTNRQVWCNAFGVGVKMNFSGTTTQRAALL
jgi:hypothetical protein